MSKHDTNSPPTHLQTTLLLIPIASKLLLFRHRNAPSYRLFCRDMLLGTLECGVHVATGKHTVETTTG